MKKGHPWYMCSTSFSKVLFRWNLKVGLFWRDTFTPSLYNTLDLNLGWLWKMQSNYWGI